MTLPFKPFYFLRHGETDWNRKHLTMGQTDISLNETGIKQAHKAVKLLRNIEIKTIVSSPLNRAIQTAEIVSKNICIPVNIINELKEVCLGVIEGKNKGDGSLINTWRNGKYIENAESFHMFKERVMSGFRAALKLPAPVLIIAHGGVYWIIQQILNLPFMDLPNCSSMFHKPPSKPNQPWFVYPINNETEAQV